MLSGDTSSEGSPESRGRMDPAPQSPMGFWRPSFTGRRQAWLPSPPALVPEPLGLQEGTASLGLRRSPCPQLTPLQVRHPGDPSLLCNTEPRHINGKAADL